MNKTVDLNVFAARLSSLIDDSDETTYTLASKLGLTAATISRYTNALMKPKMPTDVSLAQIFGVNGAWLMGHDVEKYTDTQSKTRQITDKELMFALFGGDVTEEKLSEVKKFAEFIKNKD